MGDVRGLALVVALVVLTPVASAQLPGPGLVGDVVNPVYDTVAGRAGNETGTDFTREDVGVDLRLDFVNVEFGLVGALFGGGKVQTDVDVLVNVTIRAVAVARLDEALRAASGEHDVSLNGTLGLATDRMVLTAGEIRTLGGGVLLDAFTRYQEDATRDYVESTLPGLRVLSADFAWANTLVDPRNGNPEEAYGTEPPLVLNARLRLQYLDRVSLVGLLPGLVGEADAPDTPQERLKKRIAENQSAPLLERSAFMTLGVGQLMDLRLPANWRLNLTLVLPTGFTVEGATHQFVVGTDRQAASYVVDAENAIALGDAAGVVTISNRFLVTSVLASAVLLAGVVVRGLAEAATFRVRDRLLARPERVRVRGAPRDDRAPGARPGEPPRTR